MYVKTAERIICMVIPPLLQIPGSLPFKATFEMSKTVVYNFLGVMLKKKDSWSLGWTSNPYYRILVSYVYSSVQKYFL